MAWRIEDSNAAQNDLGGFDRQIAVRILRFLNERVAPLDDPRSTGEPLRGPILGRIGYTVSAITALSPTFRTVSCKFLWSGSATGETFTGDDRTASEPAFLLPPSPSMPRGSARVADDALMSFARGTEGQRSDDPRSRPAWPSAYRGTGTRWRGSEWGWKPMEAEFAKENSASCPRGGSRRA